MMGGGALGVLTTEGIDSVIVKLRQCKIYLDGDFLLPMWLIEGKVGPVALVSRDLP